MTHIDFTIITPVYNGEDYIIETINSVLANLEPDFSYEYLVINDGSSDQTPALINKFSDVEIIQVINNENMGEAASVNYGISKSKGSFVLIVNADDPLLSPKIFSESMKVFNMYPETVVVYPDWQVISSSGEVIEIRRLPDYSEKKLIGEFWCLPGPGAIFRKESAQKIGGRYIEYKFVSDYDFWLRLSRLGTFFHLPLVLAQWRSHEDSTSISSRGLTMGLERIRVIEKFLSDFTIEENLKRSALASAYYNAALLCYFSKDVPGRRWVTKAFLSNRGIIPRADLRIVLYCALHPFSRLLIPILNRTPFINNPIKKKP